ncbi:MAG: excinuclease ABC subunit UvrA [Candidatus Hatepunaea meridiana]|nr:excinuclease ABC subunit UvrA [Candidatus Hatepunaea meridiana]
MNKKENIPNSISKSGIITIRGAREHNLKNLNITIPRDRLVVVTGISGSGKSSLVFDTLYAEGQRRYVESLSAYARQFLGLMEKPDVDQIDGLSPAISIEQKSGVRNPRSTVGTVTEIYDYLRLLYARIGIPHCPICGKQIERQSAQEIVDILLETGVDARLMILAPVVRGRKGEYQDLFKSLLRDGFMKVRVNGKLHSLEDDIRLNRHKKHSIEVIVDRLKLKLDVRERLTDSIELALGLANGLVIAVPEGKPEELFSEHFACPDCGVNFEELSPRMFSFNSPFGACQTCTGLGFKMKIDPRLVVPDPSISILIGAIVAFPKDQESWNMRKLTQVGDAYGFKLSTPFNKLTDEQQDLILNGAGNKHIRFTYESSDGRTLWEHEGTWEGVIPNLVRRYKQTSSQMIKDWIEDFMGKVACPDCKGERLRPEARAVTVGGAGIVPLTDLSIAATAKFFLELTLNERETTIARQILKEVSARLEFLLKVGLGYLTLSRPAGSLSGGEAQRIRLATQIGSGLVGVMYILDEPSIGLHQRDNIRLIETLKKLRDQGNSVIVVEHDRETIESADWVIDLGPGAGFTGGYVVAEGIPQKIMENGKSLTGRFLLRNEEISIPKKRRKPNSGNHIKITGATGNNLKEITVKIPLGTFTVVTGVSGSGKSTFLLETLYPALARSIYHSRRTSLPYNKIEGLELVDKVVDIDQSPIGRTPRSNPATYTGLFNHIRDLFARLPEAKIRGYKPGRFSFNVKGGRCEACKGGGIIKIEMHFLPDVYVTCEVCKGHRYNHETLEVRYRGKSISEVLDMSVEEALAFFRDIPFIRRKLDVLNGVGLGYIKLGQSATTLSGGEAQRIKLATELSKVATGKTIYILDEPTTGLHFADIRMLLDVLQRLVDKGNTVLVIEHNMDVIKCADWIIDLGPEGGDEGGYVIATGSPEKIIKEELSYTGKFLAKELMMTGKTSLKSRVASGV